MAPMKTGKSGKGSISSIKKKLISKRPSRKTKNSVSDFNERIVKCPAYAKFDAHTHLKCLGCTDRYSNIFQSIFGTSDFHKLMICIQFLFLIPFQIERECKNPHLHINSQPSPQKLDANQELDLFVAQMLDGKK